MRAREMLRHPSALLVIDMQNDFCHPDGACARLGIDVLPAARIVERLSSLLEEVRRLQVPVIFVRTTEHAWNRLPSWRAQPAGAPSLCGEGTWGADWFGVAPAESDRIISKSTYSAFVGTDLHQSLQLREIRTLVLTGFASNVCVETTARHAACLYYNAVLVSDCAAAATEEEHRSAVANIERYFGVVLEAGALARCLATGRAAKL